MCFLFSLDKDVKSYTLHLLEGHYRILFKLMVNMTRLELVQSCGRCSGRRRGSSGAMSVLVRTLTLNTRVHTHITLQETPQITPCRSPTGL